MDQAYEVELTGWADGEEVEDVIDVDAIDEFEAVDKAIEKFKRVWGFTHFEVGDSRTTRRRSK